MKSKMIAVFAAVLAAAAVGTSVQAGPGGKCAADIKKYCPDATDKKSAVACLDTNLAKIEDAGCKTAIQGHHDNVKKLKTQHPKFKEAHDRVTTACAGDITKYKCTGDIDE